VNTNDTPYSVAAAWSRLYDALKHSPWEEDDVRDWQTWFPESVKDYAPVAEALKYVYDLSDGWQGAFIMYEAPLAVLKAAHRHYGGAFLTPGQVTDMARRFVVFYDNPEEPLDEYLDEFHGEMPLGWLNEDGRKEIEKAVRRDSEIWIDDPKVSGVYVFYKPGTAIDGMLSRARLRDSVDVPRETSIEE